jgi:hypothetical protein
MTTSRVISHVANSARLPHLLHLVREHVHHRHHSFCKGTLVLWICHIGLSFFICYIDTVHHDIPSYRSRLGHVFLAQLSSQSLFSRVPFNSYAKSLNAGYAKYVVLGSKLRMHRQNWVCNGFNVEAKKTEYVSAPKYSLAN